MYIYTYIYMHAYSNDEILKWAGPRTLGHCGGRGGRGGSHGAARVVPAAQPNLARWQDQIVPPRAPACMLATPQQTQTPTKNINDQSDILPRQRRNNPEAQHHSDFRTPGNAGKAFRSTDIF